MRSRGPVPKVPFANIMKVWCKLNDSSPTKVEVDEDADVDDLRTAFHAKLLPLVENIPPSLLAVSGVGVSDKIRDTELIGRSAHNPFSFQTELPPKNKIPDHFAPLLLELAMKNMEIGWEKISSESTSVESTSARNASVSYYGLTGKKHCQILGAGTGSVQNAHIWPYNNRENLKLVDLEPTDIDNPKNVLRLHTEIEHKFDRFAVTFVLSGGEFILKVLDPSLRATTEFLQGTTKTFGDIEGMKLTCPSGNKPWRRLLGAHSILAHRHAREKGWLDESQLTEAESSANELMEWSLDAEAQARIKMLLNK